MALTQTASLLNHLKPLLCYVMLDITGSLCQGSNRQMTFPALPGALQLIASTPLQQYLQLETDCLSHTHLAEKS